MTTPSFADSLKDKAAPVVVERAGSGASLVAFGGISGALGIPPFEFFTLTRDLPVTRVYVRDLGQAWYHRGLPGIADDIPGIARHLRGLVGEGDRLVLVGNSMGGYAALLLGALLDADEVHAFAPQTFIDARNRASYGDDRWAEQIAAVHSGAPDDYLDLAPILADYSGFCSFNVYFSPDEPRDAIHARRLDGLPNVRLWSCAGADHSLIRVLRNNGDLARILRRALAGPPAAEAK